MPSTRRRLLIGVVIAAVLLVGGRAASVLYADYTWYDALGASPLWRERTGDLLLIYGIGSVIAVLFAFLNLSALGRSIGVLTLPRRLANVEFGEAVPRKYIDRFAFLLSIAIAAAVTPALPAWTSLALARLRVSFREGDPYFQHDLAFYTTWLPFEKAAYSWAMLLTVGVSIVVVILYSLTPGLRWERAGLRMSARVRRHLSVLAALLLLITMWSYRLQSYDLLKRGIVRSPAELRGVRRARQRGHQRRQPAAAAPGFTGLSWRPGTRGRLQCTARCRGTTAWRWALETGIRVGVPVDRSSE